MFFFEMQMSFLKAWTDAAETGLRLCTESVQRAVALVPALPGPAPGFTTTLPMTLPFGWPTAGWSAPSPFMGLAASPFAAMMPWARFGTPSPVNFFGLPMPMFPTQFPVQFPAASWPMSAMTAFAPMAAFAPVAPAPWQALFGAMPSAWTATPSSSWFKGGDTPARQPAPVSYRSASGHATAAIATPAELAQSMTDFWTAWTPGARRTIN